MGRPPVKSTKACAMAKRKGELEAEIKFWDKQPLLKKLKRLLWKKIEEIDFIELAAIIALMPIVRKVIIDPANGIYEKVSGAFDIFTQFYKGELFTTIAKSGHWERQDITTATPQGTLTWIQDDKTLLDFGEKGLTENELGTWAAAFAVSYILIKHGGEIIGFMIEGGKGIAGLGKAILTA